MWEGKLFTNRELFLSGLCLLLIAVWLPYFLILAAPPKIFIAVQLWFAVVSLMTTFFLWFVSLLHGVIQREKEERAEIIENIKARRVVYKIEPNSNRAVLIPVCPECKRTIGTPRMVAVCSICHRPLEEIVNPGRD